MGAIRSLSLTMFIVGMITSASSIAHAQSGAIALSQSFGVLVVGSAGGSGSRMDAERWAVYDCEKKGGGDCRAVGWETGRCVALAVGKNNQYVADVSPYNFPDHSDSSQSKDHWGGALATIVDDAKSRANNACSKITSECEVKAWVCG
jgi:Domain of unknown function (DUF4189)